MLLQIGRDRVPRDELYWLTIGGGRARSETLAQAGVRELREEAGIEVTPDALSEPLGTTVIRYAAFGLVPVTQSQTYFAVAVDDVEDIGGYGGSSPREVGGLWRAIRWRPLPSRATNRPGHSSLIERLGIAGHEWLTADELERKPERLSDPAIPALMRAAVAAVRGPGTHG